MPREKSSSAQISHPPLGHENMYLWSHLQTSASCPSTITHQMQKEDILQVSLTFARMGSHFPSAFSTTWREMPVSHANIKRLSAFNFLEVDCSKKASEFNLHNSFSSVNKYRISICSSNICSTYTPIRITPTFRWDAQSSAWFCMNLDGLSYGCLLNLPGFPVWLGGYSSCGPLSFAFQSVIWIHLV